MMEWLPAHNGQRYGCAAASLFTLKQSLGMEAREALDTRIGNLRQINGCREAMKYKFSLANNGSNPELLPSKVTLPLPYRA